MTAPDELYYWFRGAMITFDVFLDLSIIVEDQKSELSQADYCQDALTDSTKHQLMHVEVDVRVADAVNQTGSLLLEIT